MALASVEEVFKSCGNARAIHAARSGLTEACDLDAVGASRWMGGTLALRTAGAEAGGVEARRIGAIGDEARPDRRGAARTDGVGVRATAGVRFDQISA